jgi:hypothetical protein
VVHKGPGPSDFFVDGRFGSTPHDPNTAFSRVPRKTYLDEVPPDNNMSAFYKEKAGAKYKPKFVKGFNFSEVARFEEIVNAQYKPGPSQYNTTGLEYKTTAADNAPAWTTPKEGHHPVFKKRGAQK